MANDKDCGCGCENKNCGCENEISCDMSLLDETAWVYVNVRKDCKDQFVKFSLQCLREYLNQPLEE